MRKEVLIAIIIGFVLGLVITFGVWSANRALKQKQTTTPTQEITPVVEEITPTPQAAFNLEIITPEDQSISNQAKVTLTGKTQPEAAITIIAEKGENIVEAGQDGNFESEVTLVNGTNEITVTAFSSTGDEVSKTLSIVYSTVEI